jgi:anti-anti-sigma regulatory factor
MNVPSVQYHVQGLPGRHPNDSSPGRFLSSRGGSATLPRMDRQASDGKVLLRITGRFDPTSAVLLERELVKETGSEVTLDFGSVDELGDASVAVLSHVLRSTHPRSLRVRGLRRHQERLLKYFGVELDDRGGVRSGAEPHAHA